ncbi:MAG: hypothetical protein JWN45_1222 [Acidobacteriaceae bacterium]|nr:hypothetical protein [Acidobacteriaceae bacterium]
MKVAAATIVLIKAQEGKLLVAATWAQSKICRTTQKGRILILGAIDDSHIVNLLPFESSCLSFCRTIEESK